MSKYRRFSLLFVLSIVALIPTMSVAADLIYEVNDHQQSEVILRYAYLEDVSRNNTVEDVQKVKDWKNSSGNSPHFGFTQSAWWLKFELRNAGGQPKSIVLDLKTPLQDYVDWYVVDASTGQLKSKVLSGDRREFDFRYQGNYTLSLPLTLHAGEHLRIYMRMSSHDGLLESTPLSLLSADDFVIEKSRQKFYLGAYFGCLLAFGFCGLFIFILTREKIYLLFAIFLLLTVCTNLVYYGISAEMMLSKYPDLNNMMLLVFHSAAAGVFFLFSRRFLQLDKHIPVVVIKAFNVAIYLLLTIAPLVFIVDYATAYWFISYLILMNIALLSFFAVRMALRKHIDAIFFCLAFIPLGLALSLKLLSLGNIFTMQFLLQQNFYLAQTSLFTVVALGFSIEHSMKILRTAMRDAHSRQIASAMALKDSELKIFHLARVTMTGEMTGAVAHELSQPLSSILLNSQAAEMRIKHRPFDQAAYLAIMADIVGQAKMATAVIERVRRMLAPGRHAPAKVEVSQIFSAAQTLLRYELSLKDILLLQECAPGLQIRGDAIQLQQVIVNLVMNSIDAVNGLAGARRVITLSARRSSATHALLSVTDSGCGFTSNCQQEIFSAFFTTKKNGLGLGLNICKQIVTAHGGEILARPRLPFGSTVEFTVPLYEHV
ncbi:sensor histidine kinase [Methylobacillus gramineus]|uniref:sensor histidine kinase n=1 Tax=Methylobacillus gramineus TaxID=755169 RepID=UPI001CFFB340|nr:sensor histidine kinase [Methylobacillus gramineus]MCB5185056.1 sensor histidine kinase [Methylobacillus gramineus]